MNRRDALVAMIEALHGEIAALKANDVVALEAATHAKMRAIESVAAEDGVAPDGEVRELAAEAHRLNESCRIYVNLMTANVRRRLQSLAGNPSPAYRPGGLGYA